MELVNGDGDNTGIFRIGRFRQSQTFFSNR
jgi:hypothetical protein